MAQSGDGGLSVVMPTWNGAGLLREGLPLLTAACQYSGVPYEVLVVDNGSEDDTAEVISGRGPSFRHVRLDRNEGFGFACNVGVREARHSRVLLLNNDIMAPRVFLLPLLEHELGELFAVGSAVVPRDEAFAAEPPTDAAPSAYPLLGVPTHCCVLDRAAFLDLGGFDPVFTPAMWEEMDLGLRVWRAGGRILIDPRSRVFHYHRATVHRAFTYLDMERLYHRNRLLFLWKHLPWPTLLAHLLVRLPLECASDVLTRGGSVMTPALLAACRRLGRAAAGRHRGGRRTWAQAVREAGAEGEWASWL